MRSKNQSIFVSLLLIFYVLILVKTAWISDDAFITFRTVNNFVDGYGPVWNLSERVQVYTHPLWMFCLAIAHRLTGEFYYTVIGLSVLASAGAVIFASMRIARSSFNAVLLLIILTLSKSFVDYSTSGLENPLTYLLIGLFVKHYLDLNSRNGEEPQRPRALVVVALWAGLGILNRLDTALLFLPGLLYLAWRSGSIRRSSLLLLGGLPLLLWLLFSLFYYGFLFPNTAYAKLNTGIPQAVLIHQGILYLLNVVSVDPLTALAIITGLSAPLLVQRHSASSRASRWLSLGILLYLFYIVRIGGDFMTGRFVAAPFFMAALQIATFDLTSLGRVERVAVISLVLFVGLTNPTQSPVFGSANYRVTDIEPSGISDERGHYYRWYGLFTASRLNRLEEQGILRGQTGPYDFVNDNPGWRGFVASRHTHVVDQLALTDPLLARLPAVHQPDWRIGHMKRTVPQGYVGTLRTGENLLQDPELARYYDKLKMVVSGPLTDPRRLPLIWGFLTRRYNYLIDEDLYRYPEMKRLNSFDAGGNSPSDQGLHRNEFNIGHLDFEPALHVSTQGIQLDLPNSIQASHLDFGMESEHFKIVFLLNDQATGETDAVLSPLVFDDRSASLVPVPRGVRDQGFDGFRVIPLRNGEFRLKHLNLIRWDRPPSSGHVDSHRGRVTTESLIHLYIYSYYYANRSGDLNRQRVLDGLNEHLTLIPVDIWRTVPRDLIAGLLRIPDPSLQKFIWERLPNQLVLVNEDDVPVLRYFGGSVTDAKGDFQGLTITLYFEVLEALEREYSAWVHLKGTSGDQQGTSVTKEQSEWMVYDHFTQVPTNQWEVGTITTFIIDVELAPGRYDISTGLWTPHLRERLYHQDDRDAYWLNLGNHEVEKREREE